MLHSRRNVTGSAICRYLGVHQHRELLVTHRQSVVDSNRGGSSVQWLIQQLNLFVGYCQPRSRRSLVGLKRENRCNGLKCAAVDTDCHLTWPAMCTRSRGSKFVYRSLDASTPSHICTTKCQLIDMPLVQCKERPLIFLARRVGSRAELT